MKEFRLSPAQWRRLSSFDRKMLYYHRLMEEHYMDSSRERAEREADAQRRQRDMMKNMPRQAIPHRR